MSQPLVSVVIPIYNSEEYLPACIESVIEQSYRNIEVILVDDGSVDKSLHICKSFAEKDCRICVIHQDNAGVSAARNIGIDTARGRYVSFVDSDDELVKDCIALLVEDALLHNADIAAAAQYGVSLDKKMIKQNLGRKGVVEVFYGTDSLQLSLEFDRRMTSCHGKLFSREFLESVRFVEGRRINEDFFFVFQCCAQEPVFTYRNECLYKYFYRTNSASRASFSEKYFDMIFFAGQKKQVVEKLFPSLLDKALNMEVSTHLFLLNMLCLKKDNEYKAQEQASIDFVRKNYKKYKTKHRFENRLAKVVYYGMFPIYKCIIRMKARIYTF